MNIDLLIVQALTKHFDIFISACYDNKGNLCAPTVKAIMQARACMPDGCVNAFVKKEKP
jgi:hypothetical protein